MKWAKLMFLVVHAGLLLLFKAIDVDELLLVAQYVIIQLVALSIAADIDELD